MAIGKRLQSLIASTEYAYNVFLHNHLIRLFAACKSLSEATQVFRSVSKPDPHTWQAIIAAHACQGQAEQAIKLYHEMLQSDVKPNNYVYVAVLKACASTAALSDGRIIHGLIREAGSDGNLYVGNSLMDMYAKCRSLDEAHDVFDRLQVKDVVSWQTMIGAYVQHGDMCRAFTLFQEMEQQGTQLNKTIALSVLKACGSIARLDEGRRVHAQIVSTGLKVDDDVQMSLIGMYAKCGSLKEAHKLFDEQVERSLASWNVLIGAYAQNGCAEEAIQLLKRMQLDGKEPDRITFLSVLQACDSKQQMEKAKDVFELLIRTGFQVSGDIANTVVRIYGKLGNLYEAHKVFDSVAHKDLALWSTMIAVLTDHGHFTAALQLFKTMEQQGMQPDKFTFVHLLKSCRSILDPDQGRMIHARVIRCGLELDAVLGNTLIAMYARCGALPEARELFDRLSERTVASWNAIIGGYAQHGKVEEALKLFEQMQSAGLKPDRISILAVLKGCAKAGALLEGKKIHAWLLGGSIDIDSAVGSSLIDMYAKCGSLDLAREVFEQQTQRSVVSWNAMIGGYAWHNQLQEVLKLFQRMQDEGVEANRVTLLSILKTCGTSASLAHCKLIHSQVIEKGLESDVAVGNTLVDMYARAGDLDEARTVFDKLSHKDVVSWNAMIGGYSQHGQSKEAVHLYMQMQDEGTKANRITFLNILKAVEGPDFLDRGKEIHSLILKNGLQSDDVIKSSLVDMYAKCGSMEDALNEFSTLSARDVVSWTAIIGGFAQHGDGETALHFFQQMQQEGIEPDEITFLSVLRAAGCISALERVKQLHAQFIMRSNLDTVMVNTLVDAYSKCGGLSEARTLFDELPERTVVSWNAMIAGYVQYDQIEEAFSLLQKMKQEGVVPDQITHLSILKGCGIIAALDLGKQMHSDLLTTSGSDLDVTLGNVLIGMYVKCGAMNEARKVFDRLSCRDVLSWTTLIGGYAQNEQGDEAFRLFQHMLSLGVQPDRVTYLSILKACSSIAALDQGKKIHAHLVSSGTATDMAVRNKLLDMYVKCGNLDEAQKLFDKLPEKCVASWNALIGGYTQHGISDEAWKLFHDMQEDGAQPDRTTFLRILKDCSGLAVLNQGMQLHSEVVQNGLVTDEIIGNTLVDMYAKCGSLDQARKLFDRLPERTVVSWNAMIGAYAQHGFGNEAVQLFHEMQVAGVKPNEVTLLSVLSGCSHSGLVDAGCEIFSSASEDYGLTMGTIHYACMVDLLSRAGRIKEAEEFVNNMPGPAEANSWMSILGACQKHGNVEIATRAFQTIVAMDSTIATAYVLMSNIYAAARRWDKVAEVREQMRASKASKLPGKTWIEADDEVHKFQVGDFDDPSRRKIYEDLGTLNETLAESPAL